MKGFKLYPFVGPRDLLNGISNKTPGREITDLRTLQMWLTEHRIGKDFVIPATFVIDRTGQLRLSDRRSEHVVCAAGESVRSAGEVFFNVLNDIPEIEEITNQSTGYCPEPESWCEIEVLFNDWASSFHEDSLQP